MIDRKTKTTPTQKQLNLDAARSFQRGDFVRFANAARALDTTPGLLAKEIGYSSSAASGWARDKEAPVVAITAAEALMALKKLRAEQSNGARKVVIILPVDAQELATLKAVTRGQLSVFELL
jgi:hypothetical protein